MFGYRMKENMLEHNTTARASEDYEGNIVWEENGIVCIQCAVLI